MTRSSSTRLSGAIILLLIASLPFAAVSADLQLLDGGDVNATSGGNQTRPKEDTFADMIDRALEKEFPENEDQNEGLFIFFVRRSQFSAKFYSKLLLMLNSLKECFRGLKPSTLEYL